MRTLITKAKQFLWLLHQPLTKTPSKQFSPVSDLFLWRKSENWETFFDLTNLASLFYDTNGESKSLFDNGPVRIVIFDSNGKVVNDIKFNPPTYKQLRVNISRLACGTRDKEGTFCVLHSSTPPAISKLGCFLAERGYVSYSYCGCELRSYVHGNLDAVSALSDDRIERLGGTSFFLRQFRLQYELLGKAKYEVAIVNPSTSKQDIFCDVIEARHKPSINKESRSNSPSEIVTKVLHVVLQSGGCHIFEVKPGDTPKRLRIRSRLVMARPLVFCLNDTTMDVFHG